MRDAVAQTLTATGWTGAVRPVTGDASSRSYFRVAHPDGRQAVVMDAPPDICGSQAPFVHIAQHLRGLGLSAPDIFHADLDQGILILEDLGSQLVAEVVRDAPDLENRVYKGAVDVLLALRQPPPSGLVQQTPTHLSEMVDIAFTHYCAVAGSPVPDPLRQDFHTRFRTVLSEALTGPDVLVLRDYHAENLVWRPERAGLDRIGLLDFQDAVTGHPAYDLVSLLQDARRDLGDGLEAQMIRHYVDQAGLDAETFRFAYDAIAVQRHMRILGVFTRLSKDLGKHKYIDFVPRTWDHLQKALKNPLLEPVSMLLTDLLPNPEPIVLQRLRGT